MPSTRDLAVVFTANSGPLAAAMKRCVQAMARITAAASKLWHGRGLCGITRCPTCRPFANPRPLPIDGHEYARRRKARSRRSRHA